MNCGFQFALKPPIIRLKVMRLRNEARCGCRDIGHTSQLTTQIRAASFIMIINLLVTKMLTLQLRVTGSFLATVMSRGCSKMVGGASALTVERMVHNSIHRIMVFWAPMFHDSPSWLMACLLEISLLEFVNIICNHCCLNKQTYAF